MGIPQPAGAVLISPWVDMTHSFPSVMQNMATVSPFTIFIDRLTQFVLVVRRNIGYNPSARLYLQAIAYMAH